MAVAARKIDTEYVYAGSPAMRVYTHRVPRAEETPVVQQQEQALKAVIPNFDLRTEMQNPTFARLTSPSVGLSVEDAFYAVHRREMQAQSMQVAAQQTRQMISNAIVSGTNRPDETGTVSQAPSVSKFDYRNATPAQRKALKDEIRRAAAEGRKIYPG